MTPLSRMVHRRLVKSINRWISHLEASYYQLRVCEVIAASYTAYEHLSLLYAMRRWLSLPQSFQAITQSDEEFLILSEQLYKAAAFHEIESVLWSCRTSHFQRVYDKVSSTQILGQCRAYVRSSISFERSCAEVHNVRRYGQQMAYLSDNTTARDVLTHVACDLSMQLHRNTETSYVVKLVDRKEPRFPIAMCVIRMSTMQNDQIQVDVHSHPLQCPVARKSGKPLLLKTTGSANNQLMFTLMAVWACVHIKCGKVNLLRRSTTGDIYGKLQFLDAPSKPIFFMDDDAITVDDTMLLTKIKEEYVKAFVTPQISITSDIKLG